MKTTDFFRCDRCHIDCRLDCDEPSPSDSTGASQFTLRHCPDSNGIVVFGKVISFKERHGGTWVSVQHWIDAA
jgi:hypothetical protein